MSEELITVAIQNSVATLTLNRPDALNALSRALREQLTEYLLALDENPEVRAIIITGAGRAFCAGLDLPELQAAGDQVAEEGVIGQEMLNALAKVRCPVIAAINGFAITGGLELALNCDVIIASSRAEFADTHAKVGIVPAWGITQLLPRVIGTFRAKEMSLSGRRIGAQQAYEWGLVNKVVDPQRLLAECQLLGEEMASCNESAQSTIKGLIGDCWGETLRQGLAEEKRTSTEAFAAFARAQS